MRKIILALALLVSAPAFADGPIGGGGSGCATTGCTITGPIFNTYDPTVSNPNYILGTTSPISPNNSNLEIDCWVSGSVCPIVPIQNNQFATVPAVQPVIESWRAHCAVDQTFTIADWSACPAHTSDALGLWQSEGVDGYAPRTYSVVTATPTTAGSGYNVNDTITLAGGTLATAEGANDVRAVITVDTLTGGAGTGVATAHVTTLGGYSVAPGLTGVTQLSTTGSGTGAIFTVTKANHANSNAVNIMTQVDSAGLCGSVSGLNVPGEILFGTHNPYDNSTSAAALSPAGMNYAMKVRCDQSVDFLGGVTTNGASGGGLYYITNGSGVRHKFFDTNTGSFVGIVTDISYVISGGGSAITTGAKGYIPIDYACTIGQARLVADQSGSIVIDVWKAAGAVPTVANTITASAKPTLSSAQLSTDSTLTGWTKTVAAGDILGFNVDSASTVTQVTIALKCTKS